MRFVYNTVIETNNRNDSRLQGKIQCIGEFGNIIRIQHFSRHHDLISVCSLIPVFIAECERNIGEKKYKWPKSVIVEMVDDVLL